MLSLSTETHHAVHVIGRGVSGFVSLMSLMSAMVSGFEAGEESAENPWNQPASMLGILVGVADGLANVLAPYNAVENSVVSWISRVITTLRIVSKVGVWAASSKFTDSRKYSSIPQNVESALPQPEYGSSSVFQIARRRLASADSRGANHWPGEKHTCSPRLGDGIGVLLTIAGSLSREIAL